MKVRLHKTAKASHYDSSAQDYDEFNEKRSEQMNQLIERLLRKYKARRILDLTCGTGSQVFWLESRGFEVVGVDINSKMLHIAQKKAKIKHLNIEFLKGDVRTLAVGKFDAVITIFNAIGHLTKTDFGKAIRNIHKNLESRGLYLFDIFNLSYFIEANNITKLTIDWQETTGRRKVRDIQYSTINKAGVLASFTTSYVQNGFGDPKCVGKNSQTLQIYSPQQLKVLLHKNGFKVVEQLGMDGKEVSTKCSDRIITIARKV